MPRAKRGFKARRRRKKVMRAARGFYGARSRIFGDAVEQLRRAWREAYIGRRRKKRDFRRLWIVRINAAAREHSISYSKLMHKLSEANIGLDRKILADLAVRDPGGFKAVLDAAGAS